MRYFDELERRFMHRRFELFVSLPIAVGFLDDDAAFEQQPFEYAIDVELRILRVAHAERYVLEITEQRHAVDRMCHSQPLRLKTAYVTPIEAIMSPIEKKKLP